jgi:integrase
MNIPLNKFEAWLKAKNLKERTIEEYVYYFNKFSIYSGFNQDNVSRFLSQKTTRNNPARSFLKIFQKFLMVNYKEFGIDKDQRIEISEVELPTLSGRKEEKIIKPLLEEDILNLEKCFKEEKEKLMLLLSYYGGLRIQEMLQIKIISFNWDEWKKDINQPGECKVLGKGSKEGIAFFPGWLMQRVAKYIRSKNFPSLNSHIFVIREKEFEKINWTNKEGNWEKKIKRAGIQAGIIKLDENKKIIKETDIWPHKLRHSWGYYLREVRKLDIRDIKEILRHSNITSTQRYLYVDKKDLKKRIFDNFKNIDQRQGSPADAVDLTSSEKFGQ